jgi:uncharacterized repeat protein (TIGR01451 family)
MKQLTRWWILIVVTGGVVALTMTLLVVASPPITRPPSPAALPDQELPLASLEPDLAKALTTAAPGERLNVIVEMREQVEPAALVAGRENDLSSARRHMVNTMRTTTERSQASVRTYLASRWLKGEVERVRPFWIFNGLAVNGAHPDVVRALAARPDVALVRLDHWRRWVDPEEWQGASAVALSQPLSSIAWGVERVRADVVWNSLGISGTGVVVANMDSGVDWLHPALQGSYRGYSPKGFHQHEGNWYDAIEQGALYPVDGHGHGTHTMGTLVGGEGIGVAPGARWIAVRILRGDGYASTSWIYAGFEWVLAPNGDPDLAPQVLNNSWGSDRGALTFFEDEIRALQAAGIFVVFSAGNNGPEAGTVGSPASMPGSFAVGATDLEDEVTLFSSRGPSPWGEVRPHVAAPGLAVYSSLPGGAYDEKQGTSMAAPHVAGIATLMLSAQPDLSITRTAFILTSTARPLGDVIPNNDTGYGLVDAYAAVALAANAGVISGTVHSGGRPLAGASVQAALADGGQPPGSTLLGHTASSDDAGRYQLFLKAGHYDLFASAFGYAPDQVHALGVVTGATTLQDFDLTPLPTGRLQGTVSAVSGEAVTATLSLLGTPVVTTTSGGNYALTLPGGRYTLEARALGYRVVTASVSVTVGQSSDYHFVLSNTMRVLLVDTGARYYESQITYYRQALDDLGYVYDFKRYKHLPDATLTLTSLLSYDLLVWSSPKDSPGIVGAANAIAAYLLAGGNLFLSGQDVAYWDGGGGWAYSYYFEQVYSLFQADNAPSRQVVCQDDSVLGRLDLTIEGPGGADNQVWPDEIRVYDPDHASLACHYQEGRGAVIQAGLCVPQRVLNLGFGFESINSAADRANFMARALGWFNSPRLEAGLELWPQTVPLQIAPPGNVITHTVRLRNTGEAGTGDAVRVEVGGDDWPTRMFTHTNHLTPCSTTLIDLRVEVPLTATWNAFDAVTLTVYSSASSTLSQTVVLTSKVPAPVLLVDDDRWYDEEQVYADALSAAGVPHDYWEVEPKGFFGKGSPPADILARYPIVLWFTAYDWYDPIHPDELPRLTDYLDNGGRFFLSSQDYVRHMESVTLTRDYFGVIGYSSKFTQTVAGGVPGHVLGHGLGPVKLDYPFNNWSNGLLPAPGSQVAFREVKGQVGAVTREGACEVSPPGSVTPAAPCWRTAFFGFPFEALPRKIREPLMSRLVGWLSWMGRSDLKAERAVARVGDTVGYTLTLRNDGADTIVNAAVSNALPPGTALAVAPGGSARVAHGRITWRGDLAPRATITLTYRLSLTSGTALGVIRNTANITVGAQDIHFERWADVRVAAPDLGASRLTMTPATVSALGEVEVSLVLRNDGLEDALDVRVDNPLPWPLRLLTDTLALTGTAMTARLPAENRVQWRGALPASELVTLTFRVVAPSVGQATWVYNAARLEDGLGGAWERGAWLYVTPRRLYLPLLTKNKEPTP